MRWIALAAMAVAMAGLTTAHAQPGDAPAVVKDFEAKKAEEKAAEEKAAEAPPEKKTVTLTFVTRPRAKARVFHGKKLLGTTPFSVEWPRNSGPVDVVVRAYGYLTVNTRAYTFRDDKVDIALTRPADASKLLGYKAPIVEEEEGAEGAEGAEGETPASAPVNPALVPAAPGAATPVAPAPPTPPAQP